MKTGIRVGLLVIATAAVALCASPLQVRPTPEPGTVLLLGTGLVGLGAAAWRRSRKK